MSLINENIKINCMTLKNRLVQPPMATESADEGKVTDKLCQYYEDRAGKTGLIITEHAYITKQGQASKNQIDAGNPENLEGFRKLVDGVHTKGTTKIITQINHAGNKAKTETTGMDVVDVNTLTASDLEDIKKAFVNAACIAKEAGYDGVEVHGAHGYLLCQFYSPLVNHRTDEYGVTTLENRTRFACEVVKAVREAVGDDYPIFYRFGASDYTEGGSTIEEAGEAAKYLEATGVDCIDVTGGMNGFMIKGNTEPGWFTPLSEEIKKNVSIPVLVTGGIKTADIANTILENKQADLIGVGRPLLTDPDFSNNMLNA